MALAVCPSCGETMRLGDKPKLGERITCPECGEVLEVVELNPVELDWAFDDDDDDYYDDEYDDDEYDYDDDDW
ncbi:MAG: lysine biosynthesis protein LysW [Anaerolineae bacterium]